jgi:Cu(I)/Ag(I) efflux system membrane fusion protein/cobalt-zinc-cadmium efflux system membrane fusion protein
MSEQTSQSHVLEQQVDPFARRPHGRAFYVVIAVVVAVFAFGAGFVFRGKAHTESATAGHATTQGKQLWTCGMHPQVIQDHPGDCPICHMELTPLKADTVSSSASAERKVKYWWDPMMNPPYIADKPGKSPMGMDLVPVYEDEVSAGAGVTIDPVIVQNMGVRVAPVVFGSVQQDVRVVGYLEEPEPAHRDVNLRVKGWIEKLHADTDGMVISKGQPLFELYSPEIQVAVEELIAARRAKEAATDEQAKRTADTLFQSTSRKLELWGLEKAQVEQLAKLEHAPQTVSFLSPIDGHVTEKKVYEGAAVEAGMLVMRLANRSQMWIDAQVYEQQLPMVKVGSKVRATLVSEPGKVFEGEVIFIHPHLDPTTRTARVRMQIPNDDHRLREGMYATVDILADATPPGPVVPREAVIDTGTRQIAFVAQGGGRFEPRLLKLGTSGRDGLVQVLSGLAPNEQVVTSGQFLLDSESRLKEAIQKHLSGNLVSNMPPPAAHQAYTAMPVPAASPATNPAPPLDVPHTDEITVAYLQIAEALGATQQSSASIGVDALLAAAEMSAQHASGEGKPLAEAIAKAAEGMKGTPIAAQRKAFMTLSDAVIALLDRSAPSAKVSSELYVAYCPMAFGDKGASWVQKVKPIANPYYATEMKSCGEVKRAIAAK